MDRAPAPQILGIGTEEAWGAKTSPEEVDFDELQRARRFAMPVSLADVKLSESDLIAMKRTYDDYSKVVFAMGGFFFSTGMQWSFWIASSTDAAERKKLCHHNTMCNLVPDDKLGWMGLNPDMVYSNVVYLVAGICIMVAAASHRRHGLQQVVDAPDDEFAELPSPSRERSRSRVKWGRHGTSAALNAAGSLVTRGLLGRRAKRLRGYGLYGHYLTGMYFLTGSTIFVEGLLSGLYHTCPSKSFSQFDYIGITTCEVAIFLMMWSKCHPKLPSAGTFGLYLAALGVLSAIEVSLSQGNRHYAWIILWVLIFFLVPPLAVTLHFGLDYFCTPSDLLYVLRRMVVKKIIINRRSVVILCVVFFLTFVQIGSMNNKADWYHRLAVAAAWALMLLILAVVMYCVRRRVEHEADVTAEGENLLLLKQHGWRPVRIAMYLMWWFMGMNTCLEGILEPAKHNLSHGVMEWHAKGAIMYYLYFCGGLVYFKQISWSPSKFARLLFYTGVMVACGLLGGDYFVNSSYKPSAEVESYNIPCDAGDEPNPRVCTQAYNSSLDGDYECGKRAGRYICLIGSLDYNMGCALRNWDGHSLWHVLSAVALFVLPLSVMVIDDIVDKPRDEIAVL